MRRYSIKKRLNIPEYKITGILSETDKDIHIKLEPYKKKKFVCSGCGQVHKIGEHGIEESIAEDLPIFEKRVYLHIVKRRYKCSADKSTRIEEIPWLKKWSRVTKRFAEQISRLTAITTNQEAGWFFGLDDEAVYRLPTLDAEHYKKHLSKCKEIHILVKMYRRRGKGTSISFYDPLPALPQQPAPVYKNIVLMAVKVEEYLKENPQRTQTAAGTHFGVTRARISQLMTILEKLPDDFISIMKTTENQILIKRFSGRTLLRITALSTPEQRQSYIETIRNRISKEL